MELCDPSTHGWRQGTSIPTDLPGLQTEALALCRPLDPGDLLIIVSQDCDLVHDSFEEEPYVEVIVVRQIPQTAYDPQRMDGKNPRRLQFESTISGHTFLYEAWAAERRFIDRRVLCAGWKEYISVEERTLKVMRKWLARRYNRTALPSAFNGRVNAAQRKITDKLKSKGKLISAVLLGINTLDELPDDKPYEVTLHFLMRDTDYAAVEKRKEVLSALDATRTALVQCKGVNVDTAEILVEEDLRVSDIRRLIPWDYAEYLSERGGHVPAAPV